MRIHLEQAMVHMGLVMIDSAVHLELMMVHYEGSPGAGDDTQ
jgi:hypothetical protein